MKQDYGHSRIQQLNCLTFRGAAAAAEMSLWQLPQGGIEPREEPLAAARRELWEETGIKKAKLPAQGRLMRCRQSL